MDEMEKKLCSGCEACLNVCPVEAISMRMDEEGFYYPYISKEKCISCNKCLEICPVEKKEEINEALYAVACYAKNDQIRSKSTSGGIFPVIARYVIKNLGGSVYGVKFDEEFRAVYSRADTAEDIESFCGSKYVQCHVGNTYREVKAQLEEGRYVLFSGLPCHIEGLVSFLGEKYFRLYLVDMVCFGIGSPYIWQEYLLNFHDKKEISEIFFKDKTEGWKNWRLKFVEHGKEHFFDRTDNLYMKSYLSRINIRPSCFCCNFKGLQRKSDFTIADCWGEGEKNRELNDNRGLSALLVHTKKGEELFENIKTEIVYQEYDADILMHGNWAAYQPAEENNRRSSFFRELRKCEFRELFIEYFGKDSFC